MDTDIAPSDLENRRPSPPSASQVLSRLKSDTKVWSGLSVIKSVIKK